jgi:hypothetical protein
MVSLFCGLLTCRNFFSLVIIFFAHPVLIRSLKLQLDSIEKFKKLLPSLDTGFMEREEFSDFFKVSTFCMHLRSLVHC